MMLIEFEGDLYIKKYQTGRNCDGCCFRSTRCAHHSCCLEFEEGQPISLIFLKLRRDNTIVRYTKIIIKHILIGSNNQWRKY